MTHGEFDFEAPTSQSHDSYVRAARDRLEEFFEERCSSVFFGNQLAVHHEDEFFHWVTYRALGILIQEGAIRTEMRPLSFGGHIKLLWHRGYRYYRRDARKVVGLVEEYGKPNIGAALGLHGEQMVLGAFARKEFVMKGHSTREYGGRRWSRSNHNIDFIFERDGVAYGVEVKNTLSYMEQEEFGIKMDLCRELGVLPVFAARMLPKSWTIELIERGGYAMILKYQLYPWTHVDLARRVSRELGLPVDAPKWLAEGTMARFERFHRKRA
jgi:hypothetical protein